MFENSCFIKKNTPELRQYLEKIGYKCGGKATKFEQPYLYCSLDKYFECNGFPARYQGIVDCEENENLFCAIAALRNDSDRYQWFTDGIITEMSTEDLPSKYMQLNGHKATVIELKNILGDISKNQ